MKNLLFSRLLFLLFLSVVSLSIKAQKGDPNYGKDYSHYFTMSLSGGASGYMMTPGYSESGILSADAIYDNTSNESVLDPNLLKINPFVGGSFDIGYEYQMGCGFWFGVGVGVQFQSGALFHNDSIRRIDNVIDAEKDEASVEFTIIKWREKQYNLMVDVPIMLGYKDESGFYFGAGAKVGYTLWNVIDGDYGFADVNVYWDGKLPVMGIFQELPLNNNKSKDASFMNLPQVNPMIEIGWQGLDMEISNERIMRMKFALVGELGMLSSYNNKSTGDNLFNYTELDNFEPEDLPYFFKEVNSFYSTIPLGGAKVSEFSNFDKVAVLRSWYVGAKFTIMFDLPTKKWCNCLNNNVTKPWIKGRRDRGVE